MTVLQKLLKYPHAAVFDASAHPALAFYLQHPLGAEWLVADDVLLTAAGSETFSYDLELRTVGQLASDLQSDGFVVSGLSGDFSGMSATVLADGKGREADSNGDHVYGFTNPLHSLYGGYAKELRVASKQVGEALKQMVITQAEDEWLDLWGQLYDQSRKQNEPDAQFAPRIPKEAFRVRVNALAIEQAIKDATGKDVRIEEPWGAMFRLDESRLSGDQRFYNGEAVGPHLIRPVSAESIDWTDVLDVVNRNRAAGVVVLDPEVRFKRFIDASIAGVIWTSLQWSHAVFIPYWKDNRLDYLVLSGEDITRNWPVTISELSTHANNDPLLDPYSLALRRTIAKASVVLSDGFALGDINAVLPRAELTQGGGAMTPSSDLELSSPDQAPAWKPVDFISSETHGYGELDTGGPVAFSGAKPSIIIGRFVDASIDGTASVSVTAHFTWATAGTWGGFPWSLTQQDVLRLEGSVLRLDHYANNTLWSDLQ